ncbi:MAG: aminoacyl-tRNA deacylase [Ignisphaera sp.]|uniref:YbaK/aminoacyl-tRNA synthetase-associated domain-containing protein n=1 Tax=Ignisphaera aggregans TaxID=334771 RepID=A0A7J3JR33_9CREN
MSLCRDDVNSFIARYGINAVLKEFSDSVETVEKASRLCGAKASEIIKTLIIIADGEPVAVVLPGNRRLDYRKLSTILNARSIRMAKPDEVERYTGFEVGAVSPLSECIKRLKVVMDNSLLTINSIWGGGGAKNRLVFMRSRDLIDVLKPMVADISI